jgi:hypothetical protein
MTARRRSLVVLCGVIVMINATGATTSVLVQVRGTSIFTLPR